MDPALKFVVDVQNSEKVAQLTSHINIQTQAISALNAQLKAGAINDAQFAASSRVFGESAAAATRQIKELSAASGNAGRGLSQLSYAVDDIQYGFNAIVNNIPQIVMGLGGTAGIAGAVGIAAVAVNQLIKHWGELTDKLSSSWSGIAVDQLTKMREEAEAAAKAFEKLADTPTAAKKAQGEAVAKAITEGPTKDILRGVVASLQHERKPGGLFTDAQLNELATLRKGADAGFIDKAYAARKTKEIEDKVAGGIIGNKDPATLLRLAKEHPENFPKEFIQDLENASPEGQRRIAQKNLDLAGGRNARKDEDKAKDVEEKKAHAANLQWEKLQRETFQKRAHDEKQGRIQNLQDKRDDIEQAKHRIQENLWNKLHERHPTQILSGAKAVVDMYQKGAAGDSAKAAREKAHKLQEEANKRLASIDEQLKKERRLVLNR